MVLSCNNYEVYDLGVMVPADQIVKKAIDVKADIVGLSGLITPSLQEMVNVATEMQRAGLTIPLFVGGATTSEMHAALKIAPAYDGPVIWTKDAAQVPLAAARILKKRHASKRNAGWMNAMRNCVPNMPRSNNSSRSMKLETRSSTCGVTKTGIKL